MQDIVAGLPTTSASIRPPSFAGRERPDQGDGVLSGEPHASLPNVPTAQEQGLAGFEAANWAAFFMAKGTPAPISGGLQAATAATTGSDAVQKRMKEIGVDPVAPERRSPGIWRNSSTPRSPSGPGRSKRADWRLTSGYFAGSAAAFNTGAQRAISEFT